jgi:septal ring factor EnvC (AmiA/AmiB activator)
MKTLNSLVPTLALAAFASYVLLSPELPNAISAIPAAIAAQPSKLGDLSSFRTIASDTSQLVIQNQLARAKDRIKDLETTWDEAEPSLKPRAAADWHKLDKAIDEALEALRARSPNQATCQEKLTRLIAMMDQMSGKA